MRGRGLLAAVLTAALVTGAAAQEADPVRQVREAWARMEGDLPLIRELTTMGAEDQLVRRLYFQTFRAVGAEAQNRLKAELEPVMFASDRPRTERLKAILAVHEGWFPVSRYGSEASGAAFLIVQHSEDLDLMKDAIARMAPLLGTGEIDGQDYALLYDRIAVQEGRPQRFATQIRDCVEGRRVPPARLEEPDRLDEIRAEAGLPPMAQYLEAMQRMYGACRPAS